MWIRFYASELEVGIDLEAAVLRMLGLMLLSDCYGTISKTYLV
jgi:hypothetical protein